MMTYTAPGYKLHYAHVVKTIAYYQDCGRKVDVARALEIGELMVAHPANRYESAGAAEAAFASRIWNSGLVQ